MWRCFLIHRRATVNGVTRQVFAQDTWCDVLLLADSRREARAGPQAAGVALPDRGTLFEYSSISALTAGQKPR